MSVSGNCNVFHDEFQYEENHHIQSFCYEEAANRVSAVGYEPCPGLFKQFDEKDIGKVAREKNQSSGDGIESFWALCGINPTEWCELTNTTIPPSVDVKVACSNTDTTAGFLEQKLIAILGTNVSSFVETIKINPGGNEQCGFQFDPSQLNHDDLENSDGPKHIIWGVSGPELIDPSRYLDELVKCSPNDTTPGTLSTKLSESVGSNTNSKPLQIVEVNDGGNETCNFRFDQSKVDHNSLANYVANEHIDWTTSGADQIDPSRYTDLDEKVKVDATDTPGNLEDKICPGPNILINKTGPVGDRCLEIQATGDLTSDCPALQIRRTTSQNYTGSYVDVTFDTTDVENESAVLEHDNTNTDRILVKEDGLYQISYKGQTDIFSQGIFNLRVRKNDSVVLPGSETFREDGGDSVPTSGLFYAELVNGDFLSLQIQNAGGSGVYDPDIVFAVSKCAGAKGDKGDPGVGSTIDVESGGSVVPGGPFDCLDFSSPDFVVTNPSAGKARIALGAPANVFGTEHQDVERISEAATTSSNFVQYLSMTTTSLPAGRYRIGVRYNWWHNSTGNDFSARLHLDNSDTLMNHQQEPKDPNSNQSHCTAWFAYRNLTAGIHKIDLDFREQSGGTSFISNGLIELWRVS